MKTRYCCALLAGLVGLAVHAAAQPKLKADSFQIDLGMVESGTVIERELELRNAGDEPLVIEKVQTSCPCTTVSLPDGTNGVVGPGDGVALQLRYDTEDRHGSYGAALVIHSNDLDLPIAVFEIGIVITKPVITDPPDVFGWGLAPRGHTIDKPLILRAGNPEQPIEFIDVQFAEAGMAAATATITNDGPQRIETHFTLAPDLPLGVHKNEALIRVRVNEKEHQVRVPIQGGVLGDVLITPPAIIAPRSAYSPGDKISEITVQASGGSGEIRVVGAPTTGALETAIRPREEGDGFVIDVLAGRAMTSGPQSGTVYVMTSSLDEPVVGVPVFFRTADAVAARPYRLVIEAGNTAAQRVELAHAEGDGFVITDVRCNSKAVTVRVESAESAGADAPAVIAVRRSVVPAEGVATLVEIETNANGGAIVYLPVLLRAAD